jgi:hypothetical protein
MPRRCRECLPRAEVGARFLCPRVTWEKRRGFSQTLRMERVRSRLADRGGPGALERSRSCLLAGDPVLVAVESSVVRHHEPVESLAPRFLLRGASNNPRSFVRVLRCEGRCGRGATVGQALTGVGSGRGGVRRSLEGHEEGVPWVSTSTPRFSPNTLRRTTRCFSSTSAYSSASSSLSKAVEPSTSVNINVTVPVGSPDRTPRSCADRSERQDTLLKGHSRTLAQASVAFHVGFASTLEDAC